MEPKKTFPRVGARNLRVADIQSHELQEGKRWYCPHCGAGPLDGVTGARFETDEQDDGTPLIPTDGQPSICLLRLVHYLSADADRLEYRQADRGRVERVESRPGYVAGFASIPGYR